MFSFKIIDVISSISIKNNAPLEKIILGIDPGTNIMGYGVIKVTGRKVTMESMGVIDLHRCKDVYL